MAQDEDAKPTPLSDDDTVIDLRTPAALDDDPTVLDDAAAVRQRSSAAAPAGMAEVTVVEAPPAPAPQPMAAQEASTVAARGPTAGDAATAPGRVAPLEVTQPAGPPEPTTTKTPASKKKPGGSKRPRAAGARGSPPAPQPMTFAERTGITKLITAAMNQSERRRRIAIIASLGVLVLLVVVLVGLLPSSSTSSRLTGWLDALPASLRPEPAADYPALPEPQLELTDETSGEPTRRVRQPRGAGPANALEAFGDSPHSRKLGADVDAASARLRPGASGADVAQPMKSRGGEDSQTLGIGTLGNEGANSDATGKTVHLDPAAMRASATGKIVTLEGLGQTAAQAVFKRAEVQFRYCYEAAIDRNATAQGRVKLAVEVGRSGTVTFAVIEESGLEDSRTDACVLRVAERLRFPSSANESRISYLWIFVRGS